MTKDSVPDDDRDPGTTARFRESAERSTARDWAFCRLVILVVDAPTRPDAVVDARETYFRMAGGSSHFDEFQLIADFEEGPSEFLVDRWGQLPGVTSVSSVAGERLVDRAISRTGEGASYCPVDDHDTYLYDGIGDGVRSCRQFGRLIGTASERVWLVPAITLHGVPSIDTGVSII